MAMDANEIEQMIKTALPDAEIELTDLAGDGDHYSAKIISSAFIGKSRVQQHQMVYKALQGNMGGVLHALALETQAPETQAPETQATETLATETQATEKKTPETASED